MSARRGPAIALVVIMLLAIAAPPVAAYDPVAATERISVDSAEGQAIHGSSESINTTDASYDGRFVVFQTHASLDPADTDSNFDAYIRDRLLGTTTVVDPTPGVSIWPSISADGRYVAFTSFQSAIVPDTNNYYDVVVLDQQDGSFTQVSVASDGSERPQGGLQSSISADGRFVTFLTYDAFVQSDTGGILDTYVHDRDADADGVFDEPGAIATVPVSVATDGTLGNGQTVGRISPNGRFVVLNGSATNFHANDLPLCEEVVYNPEPPFEESTVPADCSDVWLHDRDVDVDGIYDEAGAISTVIASANLGVPGDGASWDADVSDDGDIAFTSRAENLGAADGAIGYYDSFVWERDTGMTTRLGGRQRNGGPSISNSGRYVTFESEVSNGGVADTNNVVDAYVYDRVLGTHARASVNASGGEVALGGLDPLISGDGRHVVFVSYAASLVPGDTNGAADVFVRDLLGAPSGTTTVPGDTLIVPIDPITETSPVSLTFTSITAAGTTHLTTSTDGPRPISGFSVGEPPTYYDISTSATFTGSVEVCISYGPTSFPDTAVIALFHFDLALYTWVNITTSVDTTNHVICGLTTSFSPFAVFAQQRYAFDGFFSPVDNAPTMNVLKAGAAVPIRFRLGGDHGLDVLATGSPGVKVVSCATGLGTDQVEQTVTASASTLLYHAGSQTYTYVWKTSKTWANSCRQIVLTFEDGIRMSALFKFTK